MKRINCFMAFICICVIVLGGFTSHTAKALDHNYEDCTEGECLHDAKDITILRSHNCNDYFDVRLESETTPVGTASQCQIIHYYYEATCTFPGCRIVETYGHSNSYDNTHNYKSTVIIGQGGGKVTHYECIDCGYSYYY